MGDQDMTQIKRFGVRGQRPANKPYHYRASGLDDVYLTSGVKEKKTAYGPAVEIQDIPGLHRAIGHSIINESKPLSAREFRFLRKNMDLTQEALAARLRVDAQTVARYEKDQTAIPGATDTVVRIMFALHIARELIANYDELERGEPVCHHEWIRITASTRASPPTPHWMCSKCGQCTRERAGEIGCNQEK